MQSVSITTKTVSSNLAQARCTRYNIMWQSLSVICERSDVFSGTPVYSTNKTDRHDITEILLKVVHHHTPPPPTPKKHTSNINGIVHNHLI